MFCNILRKKGLWIVILILFSEHPWVVLSGRFKAMGFCSSFFLYLKKKKQEKEKAADVADSCRSRLSKRMGMRLVFLARCLGLLSGAQCVWYWLHSLSVTFRHTQEQHKDGDVNAVQDIQITYYAVCALFWSEERVVHTPCAHTPLYTHSHMQKPRFNRVCRQICIHKLTHTQLCVIL